MLSVVRIFALGETSSFPLAVCGATHAKGRQPTCVLVTPGTSHPAQDNSFLPFIFIFIFFSHCLLTNNLPLNFIKPAGSILCSTLNKTSVIRSSIFGLHTEAHKELQVFWFTCSSKGLGKSHPVSFKGCTHFCLKFPQFWLCDFRYNLLQ